jgi:hypothetical protein
MDLTDTADGHRADAIARLNAAFGCSIQMERDSITLRAIADLLLAIDARLSAQEPTVEPTKSDGSRFCTAEIYPSWSDSWVTCGSVLDPDDGRCVRYGHDHPVTPQYPTEPTKTEWAAEGAMGGIATPGCDCGHREMGRAWHSPNCAWRATGGDST